MKTRPYLDRVRPVPGYLQHRLIKQALFGCSLKGSLQIHLAPFAPTSPPTMSTSNLSGLRFDRSTTAPKDMPIIPTRLWFFLGSPENKKCQLLPTLKKCPCLGKQWLLKRIMSTRMKKKLLCRQRGHERRPSKSQLEQMGARPRLRKRTNS